MTLEIEIPNAQPIRPGYAFELRFDFDCGIDEQAFYDAEFAEGRLVAQFRQASDDVLFEADTEAGTIQREEARTLALYLDENATAGMAASRIVVFDFIAISNGVQRPIPGLCKWPVDRTVTRDVV